MITSEEMAVVDENAAALGVSRKQLMESSGRAVARVVGDIAEPGEEIAVVCGRGNNGGDAFVATRFLDAYRTRTYLLGRPETIRTEIARENFEALVEAEYDVTTVRDSADFAFGDPEVIVDGMLGTGGKGPLREPEASVAGEINDATATVVSVDVPSGVDADTGETDGVAVDGDHVVTFHDAKPGLDGLGADVTVADIGIPETAELFVERGDLLRLSRRPDAAHKGEFGRVLVVGGGPYTGAPALTARAVLRAGADLVYVAVPESIAQTVQGYSEDLIIDPLEGSTDRFAPPAVPELLERAGGMDSVVLGPGIGDHNESTQAVASFLGAFDGTAVVDADALGIVADIHTDATLVCTPHSGEFREMGKTAADDWRERVDDVETFAAEFGNTILLKGRYDVISDGETTRVNRTGNPGMTVGGTGDVLAGATGALACVLDPVDAAAVAAYATGRAGDRALEESGYGLVGSDLLEWLPAALWADRA